MKAMILNAFGTTDGFDMVELEKPTAGAGQVVVNVMASSVNTVDTMIRAMGDELPLSPALPAVLGMDFAGVISEVGPGVNNYKVGDEVYGCAGGLADLQGSLAEYMLVDANLMALKPKGLTMAQAAALPLVGITAYEGLMRANIEQLMVQNRDVKVLVHGGSGGVGHVALQLAKYFGADVYATGGGEPQLALIEHLGATPINYKTTTVEDYVEQHTATAGFELVFDSVGGMNMLASFDAAALNGQVVSTVSMVEMDLSTAHFKGLSLHVVFMLIPMLHNAKRETHGEILARLAEIVDAGGLKPVLDSEHFSLAQIGQAHERLTSGLAMGKVVVEHV
ncbi:MAG: zinc-dependent alcohol dehydrogenase family protein [Psychrobium sp.]